jgi:hypothetical protein
VQRIVRRWQLLGVASCFSEWKDFAVERKHLRKLAGRVFQRLVNGNLVSAWETWVEIVVYRSRYSSLCANAVARLAKRSISGAVVAWKSYVLERRRARYLVKMCYIMCHTTVCCVNLDFSPCIFIVGGEGVQ